MKTELNIDDMYSMENEFDWDYIENESGYSVRYDFKRGSLSMWIHKSGSIEGHAPASLKKTIVDKALEFNTHVIIKDLKFI